MQVIKQDVCMLRDLKTAREVESPMTRNYFFHPAYCDHSRLLQFREGKHPQNPRVPSWGSVQELGSNFPFSNCSLSREGPRLGVGLDRKEVGQTEPTSREVSQGRYHQSR